MRTYTTPTLRITLKKKSGEIATDLIFTYLIFTIKSGKNRIDKTVQSSEVTEGVFTVRLTQEETGSLSSYGPATAEINIFNGSTRLATLIKSLKIDPNLIEEVV